MKSFSVEVEFYRCGTCRRYYAIEPCDRLPGCVYCKDADARRREEGVRGLIDQKNATIRELDLRVSALRGVVTRLKKQKGGAK